MLSEMDKEIKYNICFLTSLRVFASQIREWIAKIAKIDYDEIAKLVTDFEELKEKSLTGF